MSNNNQTSFKNQLTEQMSNVEDANSLGTNEEPIFLQQNNSMSLGINIRGSIGGKKKRGSSRAKESYYQQRFPNKVMTNVFPVRSIVTGEYQENSKEDPNPYFGGKKNDD